MTNKDFTSLLKKAEKLSYWDNNQLVTLGYAYTWGISGEQNEAEAEAALKEIENEVNYRSVNDIALTAAQQEILNK